MLHPGEVCRAVHASTVLSLTNIFPEGSLVNSPKIWAIRPRVFSQSKAALAALEGPLRRDFLQVLDHPRSLSKDWPSGARQSLLWWEELGSGIGITESELRAQMETERRESSKARVAGCSWSRCIHFKRESDAMVLLECAGCHRSSYCGLLCQSRRVFRSGPSLRYTLTSDGSRDWEEGGHRDKCD